MLLPCVAIIFTITYWAEKWELLQLSRVPNPSAGDLAALTGTPCDSPTIIDLNHVELSPHLSPNNAALGYALYKWHCFVAQQLTDCCIPLA